MTLRHSVLMLLTVLSVTGCYLPISGRVIDAETQQPIEGAVVFVEWNEQHGIGFTYHTVYKVAETETSKKGNFSLPGAYSPFVDPPRMIIYKKGYIAWNNESIFPDWKKRTDFTWGSGTFRLEKFITRYPTLEPVNRKDIKAPFGSKLYKWDGLSSFNPKYTHYSHVDFIDDYIWRSGNKIKSALDVEEKEARKDVNAFITFELSARIIDSESHEGISGAVVELSGGGLGYPASNNNWPTTSDEKGNVLITANAPLLARPPSIVIKKNGYYIWDFWNRRHDELDFWEKLRNGFAFELQKCEEEKIGVMDYRRCAH